MSWAERRGRRARWQAVIEGVPSVERARSSLRTVALAAVALFGVAVGVPATGCTTTEKIPGEKCVGGIIDDDGNCVAKCDPDMCLEGNVCVDNACRLKCTTHQDCYLAVQECAPAQTDPDAEGAQENVTVCLENGRAPVLTNGYPAGWYGTSCVGGNADCALQLGCPNGLECNPASCGDCEIDEAACAGKELCNIGKCASSGERCTFNTCPLDQCTPFLCLGWIGEGDTEAYCTNTDCSDDAHCPAGFFCGARRDARALCGATPPASPLNVCGNTTEPCVDPAAAPAGGQFFEGPSCLMQGVCRLRGECAPCESNLDCSLGAADVCTNHFEANVCARFCNDNADCAPDEHCLPYNGAKGGQTCSLSPNVDCSDAATDCAIEGDFCVARQVCLPQSGACDGRNFAPEKFCAHCLDDTDCGPPGSGYACINQSGGHPACLDITFAISCTTNADCPAVGDTTVRGRCLDENDLGTQNSPLYHKCYFPKKGNEYRCW
jgi:hypothetical protein